MSPSGNSTAAASDPWLGRVIGGRWKILSLLDDSGGMASVYLADDTRLERKAVVKIPKAAHLNAEFAERFAREVKWHAQVENVHVVHILDRGEEGGTPFLVLQYLPGGNLKSWCSKNPAMLSDPRLHFEAWLLPVAQALDAVASKGIVHRDVKPTNILFDADGKGYLSDFGIVKAGSEATLTGTGLFIGTLQFMSPEQCQNERVALDGRSDQFGLAVTVYQVLTGWKYPTIDDTAVVYAAKFGHTRMTEPREHTPLVPQAVNEAVMKALSPDRDKRFVTSVEFVEAVRCGLGSWLHSPLPAQSETPQSSADQSLVESLAATPKGVRVSQHLPPGNASGMSVGQALPIEAVSPHVSAKPAKTRMLRRIVMWSAGIVGSSLVLVALLIAWGLYADCYRRDFRPSSTWLDPELAQLLVQSGRSLNLDHITELAPGAAKALSKHKGDLSLNGLVELSDEAAEALSRPTWDLTLKFRAIRRWKRDLSLDGLTTLSAPAAEALARHEGGTLSLNGLTTLSDEAARALARYDGFLFLDGLTTLSDEAARALARYEYDDQLSLHGLTTLSEEAAAVLRANPHIVLPAKFRR